MKKLFAATLFALLVTTTSANAGVRGCVPAYMKDEGTWVLSVVFILPLLAINVLARVGDLPNRGAHLYGLTCTTLAMGYHIRHNRPPHSEPKVARYSSGNNYTYLGNWVNAPCAKG